MTHDTQVRTFDAPAPTLDAPQASPVAPVTPAPPRRLPVEWTLAVVGSWMALMTVASFEPPLPDDLAIPYMISAVGNLSAVLLIAALVGLARRRPGAALVSAASAGIGLTGAVWCATHLGVGTIFISQAAGSLAVVGVSLAAFAKGR